VKTLQLLIPAVLILPIALAAQSIAQSPAIAPASPATGQLRQLQDDLKRAHAAKDSASYLADARKMSDFMNSSPDSLLQLMSAQAFAGDITAALSSFADFVDMGQSNEEVLQLPQFEQLRRDPRFAEIHARMTANTTAVSRASEVFSIADPGLIPEDIDYDPSTKLLYVTSVLRKKILSVTLTGSAQVFVVAPDSWPMMALKIDPQHHLLWATEVALNDFDAAPKADWGRSAILIYDLRNGKLLHRIEGPSNSALGDMTLTADGDAIVSDGENGGVYRILHKTLQLERLDSGEFVSPQTPAISSDGKRLFIPDYVRGIGSFSLETKHVDWIPMNVSHALSGIDGLYLNGRTLIATQNGTSPERVIEFPLDPSLTSIQAEVIIERSTPTLGDPTHGVIIGDYFYYIANSGWDTLDDHGHRKPDAHPSAPLIMKARLHD
jgi:hypothetical protein